MVVKKSARRYYARISILLSNSNKYAVLFSAIYCPKLTVPDNGELSTKDVAWNTVVTVTCNRGFKMIDDQLSKSLLCLDQIVWNDTVTNCQRAKNDYLNIIQ